MTTAYVWRDGQWLDKATGKPDPAKPFRIPKGINIIHDIPAHLAPNGRYIGSRSALKDLEARDNLIPYERSGMLKDAPKGVYDAKCDKWQSWMKGKLTKVATKAGFDASSRAIEDRMKPQMKAAKDKVLSRSKQD